MMLRSWIFTSLIFVTCVCHGQTTFSRLYWNYPYTTLALSICNDANNFYLSGRGSSFVDGSLEPSIFFLKTDLLGAPLKMNHLIGDGTYNFRDGFASSSVLVNDTVLYVAGYYSKYNALFPPWFREHNGMLYAFNLEGDTIFTKKYVGDGDTEFSRLIFDGNNLILGGDTRDTIDLLSVPVPAYLLKVNLSGDIIWDKKLGDGIQEESTGLMDVSSSSQIVTGGTILENIDMGSIIRNGKVYKVDALGTMYFSKEIGTPGADTEIEVKVSKNYQSNIVRQNLDTVINEGDYAYVQYIGKTDTNFNFIWRTFLNDAYYKYIYTLRTFDDGSIVAVGGIVVDDTYNVHGYIVKLDSNGTVLWERDYTYNSGSDHYLYDFQKLPDGGYACSGMGADTIDGVMQSMCWLLRLDSMGCLEPGCGEVAINNFTTQEEVLIQLYPNPMHHQASIAIHVPTNLQVVAGQTLECDIVDMQGRVVDHYSNIYINNPGETIRFSIFKRHLAAGTYLVTVRYGNQILGAIDMMCAD